MEELKFDARPVRGAVHPEWLLKAEAIRGEGDRWDKGEEVAKGFSPIVGGQGAERCRDSVLGLTGPAASQAVKHGTVTHHKRAPLL